MANNCYYEMAICGTKESCVEWLNRMRGEDCSVYKRFYRVFDSDVVDEGGSDKNYFMHIVGDCAWSLYCCGHRDEPEDLFAKTTEELSMVMEAYSSEPGMGFQEHFIYDNGEMIADECEDYTEVYWDRNEFERIEDFIKEERELNITEEDFDEDGIARIGGFGEDWGDFTYKRLPDLLHPFRDYNPDNEHCFEDSDESIMSLVM